MALTFSSLGGLGFQCVGALRPLIVFPPAASTDKNAIILLPAPEEDTNDNVISWPGEYNKGGVSIRGIGHTEGQQVSYIAETDGVRCAFLSSPLQDWTDKQMEVAGDIDVLVLPADEPKVAQKLIDDFDPRVLILLPGKDADAFDAIAKHAGVKPDSTMSEYKLKGTLPAEGREVVVLRK
ncbi:MAG: hypothetical protein PHW10_04790 [Candidatus Peribacteraceae bacterium]|nr:hypothetical protein [Candidatus Peribacteraceae bacterium]